MIGDILNAILQECREFLSDADDGGFVGTVILKTEYSTANIPTYSMPLLLLDMTEGSESRAFIGGAESMDWSFAFNSYNHNPDGYTDDALAGGYSADLLDVIDLIRQHFSFKSWLTPGMTDIEHNYGFVFTFGGITKADVIDGSGLIQGWRVMFESMSIDEVTEWVEPSESVLEEVTQVGDIEVNEEHVGYTQTLNLLQAMATQEQTVPDNTLLNSVSLFPAQGTPTIRIGTTDGGNEILDDTEVVAFQKIELDKYFADETILYVTTTAGAGLVNVRMDVSRNYFNFPT